MNGDMAARIAASLTAGFMTPTHHDLGNSRPWERQLRDKDGQWAEMGSMVKWFAGGQGRTGKVVEILDDNIAEVQEDVTGRRIKLGGNRLSVVPEGVPKNPVDRGFESRAGRIAREAAEARAKAKGGSQPEPDTVAVPATPTPEVTAVIQGSMPQEQIDRTSQDVNWTQPTSSDAEIDQAYRKWFPTIEDDRTPDGHVRPGSPTGTGTADDPIYVGHDIARAQELILEGKHIRLGSRQDLVRLLSDDFVDLMDAKKPGDEVNMCLVTVPDTSLFCDKNQNVIRNLMPQLSGKDKTTGKTKNVQPWLEDGLEQMGLIGDIEPVDPNTLAASQSELGTKQIIGMKDAAYSWLQLTNEAEALRANGNVKAADAKIRERDTAKNENGRPLHMPLEVLTLPIMVTDDGYIIDGHHRWAALILLNEQLKADGISEPIPMNVRRVKMEIGEALVTVNEFADAAGIAKKASGKSGTSGEGGIPRVLLESNVPDNVKQWMAGAVPQMMAELNAQVTPDMTPDQIAAAWKAAKKAKSKSLSAKKAAIRAAGTVESGDMVVLLDGGLYEVVGVVAEVSGGVTLLKRNAFNGDLSLSILASGVPVEVLGCL